MGSKGGSTQQTSTSSSSSPPPQVMAEYQSLVDRATNVANQPYQPYQGELVAPLSSQTNAGLGGISQFANTAQPYLGAAGAMTMSGSGAVNPEQFGGMGSLAPYMNPYTQSVIGSTEAEMQNQNEQQAQFLNSANISSGAFGGDRAGIGQSILANQQQLAEAPTIAGLNQANYNQAMTNWQNQQGVNLAAQQANQARLMSGAAQLGQIGQSAQQAGLQGAQADIQAGMIPQQEQQAIDTAAQQMYQTSQAYPFTTTGWLGNIIEGTGSLSGGQGTSTTTSPAPNMAGQVMGAGLQGLGILGNLFGLSDERAKENIEEIGKTYDGQNIYRYNFKGDPRTQIGLLAQEEAYHDPGSVQRIGMGDLLGIDYRGATDEAAERGHFADGGMAEPPPGGVPQGVTQGMQPSQPLSGQGVDYALMMSGDPMARSGLGSMALLGGTNMRPQPGFDTIPLRPSGEAPRQGFQGGGTINPEYPVSYSSDPRQTAYAGWTPGTELDPTSGVATSLYQQLTASTKDPSYGLDLSQIDAIGGGQWMPPVTNSPEPDWQNLQNSPQFGSAESSLAGAFGGTEASAPTGSGGVMPPTVMGGGRAPGLAGLQGQTQGGLSIGQLGNLAGQYFGGGGGGAGAGGGAGGGTTGGYTPGSVPPGTNTLAQPAPAKPAAPSPVEQAALGGSSTEQAEVGPGNDMGRFLGMLGAPGYRNAYSDVYGGAMPQMFQPGKAAGGGIDAGGFSYVPGSVPAGTDTLSKPPPTPAPAPAAAPTGDPTWALGKALYQSGNSMMQPDSFTSSFNHPGGGDQEALALMNAGVAAGFGGGGMNMNRASGGRTGFQSGGFPRFTQYQPGTSSGRTPPSYSALDLSGLFGGGQRQPQAPVHPVIQMQRQLQGRARPPARGVVRPRVIAPDPPPVQPALHSGYPDMPIGVHSGHPDAGGDPQHGPLLAPRPPIAPPNVVEEPRPGPPMELSGATPASPVGTRVPSTVGMGLAPPPPPEEPPPKPMVPPAFEGHTQGGFGPHMITEGEMGGAPGPMAPIDPEDRMLFGHPAMEKRGGRVLRFRGGRLGFQDGGDAASSNMPFPGQVDPKGVWAPSASASPDLSGVDWSMFGGPDWSGALPGGDSSPPDRTGKLQIDPRAVALAPTVQGGGGGYRGDVTSLMGGPPITAGHFVPTTGNARGATFIPGAGAISPNARAQAPEHPAITIARHIARTAHGAGYAAGHAAGRAQASGGPGVIDPEIVARQRPWVPTSEDYLGGVNSAANNLDVNPHGDRPPDVRGPFQGGGGVMGASPIGNAGAYTPQGYGMSGQTSQGEGLGSFATSKAASGFGDLFGGGGRAGFADGGETGLDPFLAAIQASSGAGGRMGPGPGPPPQAPQAPSQGGGGQPQPGSPGDLMGKLGDLTKQFKGKVGVQTAPTGADGSLPTTGADPTGGWGDIAPGADVSGDFANLPDNTFDLTSDVGFATGGGVGLGSLRGNFQDGGDPTPDQIDAEVAGAGQPVAAPTKGGGTGGVPEMIRQSFGDRAGYASTISRLESGYGSNYVGDGGSSFGPFQLHYGGVNKDMPHPGLGDAFTQATGLDARDPKTVPDQIKFVANYTAQHGWKDWSTKAQADKIAGGGGDVPAQDVEPAQASTEAYGGGFRLPGPDQQQQQQGPPTIGSELRRDPFGYMMTVGAGMMASRSPWLGTQIGEGFVAGNKYLGELQNLDRQWGVNQAQIANLSAEAREHGADADLKAQQIQLSAIAMKVKIQAMREMGFNVGGGGADGSAAPSPTAGPGAPSGGLKPLGPLPSGAGAGAAPGPGAGPSGAGGAGADAAPSAAGAPDIATDPDYQKGNQLIEQGKMMNARGKIAGVEGMGDATIQQGQAMVDAANKRFDIAKTASEKTTEAGLEAQKPAMQDYVENRKKFMMTYDQTRSEIGELANIYQNFQSGRQSEAEADLASWANAAGFKLPQAAGFDAGMKSAIQQAFAAVANSGLQKAPRAGLREATMMVASPTRDPAALRKILSDQLATLDQNYDLYSNVRGRLGVDDDIAKFMKTHKYEDYLGKARKELPFFKGLTPDTLKIATGEKWPDPLPPKGKAQPGERYTMPDGKIVRMQPDGSFAVEYEP